MGPIIWKTKGRHMLQIENLDFKAPLLCGEVT